VPTPEPEPAPQPAPAPQPEPPAPAPEPVPQPEPPLPAPEPVPQPEPGPAPAPPGPLPEPPPAPEPVPPPEPMPPIPQATDGGSDGAADNRLLSPVVRRLVNEYGLDPGSITGTGAGGRITREDVLAHIERSGAQAAPAQAAQAPPAQAAAAPAQAAAPAKAAAPAQAPAAAPPQAPAAPSAPAAAAPAAQAPAAPAAQAGERDESVRLSKIRKLTGDHMIMSKAVTPHAFSVVEVDYANVDRTRSAVKGEWKASEGFSLTYLPFICRALIDGLAQFPHLNASVGEKELVVHRYIDLGIAVDLDYQGLLVPVIRDAETKRLRAIAREISDLAGRAKSRKLSPDEIQGGTFTVSNNGSAGSVLTAPIINQPQVAIVSTDGVRMRPVALPEPGGGWQMTVRPTGNLSMSFDHRAVDGAYASAFLAAVRDTLAGRDWRAELS